MSFASYEKAIESLRSCEGFAVGKPHSAAVIAKAEELLGLSFSPQVRDYLSKYGYIEFFGVELYGIIDESFTLDDESPEGCMVEWTLCERENGLDRNWVALRFEDDGAMAFLDFGSLNSDGEPRVIIAEDRGSGYEYIETAADDLGEYLLLIKNA